MAVLERFDTPGRLRDGSDAVRAAWNARVRGIFANHTGEFLQLADPTATELAADAQAVPIVWAAFPARLLRGATSEEARWRRADDRRDEQDEYCEWAVERDPATDKVTKVTFTTEVPEYWTELAASDPDRLVELYRELTGFDVELEDLLDGSGTYDPRNVANRNAEGRIAHLSQANNTLGAAVDLVAVATVQRFDADGPVTTKQALARCAGLGDPFRNSDPQIASVVNGAAATGALLTLADPAGLYLDAITTTGMATPDDADPASFWTVERGDPDQAVRASFRVPEGHDYEVGDVTIGGHRIEFGAQLADRVSIRITGLVSPGNREPRREPCK
jgi:hypothetical protein